MKDFQYDWSQDMYHRTYKLPSKFMLTVMFSMESDWGNGAGPRDMSANIGIITAKKRKKLSTTAEGAVTGPGGFDVYCTVKECIETFTEQWFEDYRHRNGNLRLYAYGANQRLQDAYEKVLPRLGFYKYHRGFTAMEKIITPHGTTLQFDYSERLQEIEDAQRTIDRIVSESAVVV